MKTAEESPYPQKARGVIVAEMPDGETLVYDRRDHTAHALNAAASLVGNRCDGATAPAQIGDAIRAAGHSLDDLAVWVALAELQKKNLVENVGGTTPITGLTRRDLMSVSGSAAAGAAVALPAVSSIVARNCGRCLHLPGVRNSLYRIGELLLWSVR